MATDYDEPRNKDDNQHTESIEALKGQDRGRQSATIDAEDSDTAEGIDLPGADLSDQELIIKVIPQQDDEFTCMSCFLVKHRSQLAKESRKGKFCRECEG